MTSHSLHASLELDRPLRRVNPLSPLPMRPLTLTDGRDEPSSIALLTAHTGVVIVRIEGERSHRVLIDPSRAVLVGSDERWVVEAAAPEAQKLGILEFTPRLLESAGVEARSLARRLSLAIPPVEIPWSSRLTFGLLLLLRGRAEEIAEIDAASPLAGDIAALLHQALADFDAPRTGIARSGSRARAAHRKLVESAKTLIAAAPEQPHLLADIARAVSASSFHLEHVFQQQAGIPLHRFLLDFRLTLALNRLATDRDLHLSTLALSLGFATHSHFTAAFRRALGRTPTAARRALFAAPAPARIDGCVPRYDGIWLRILRTRAGLGAMTIPLHAHTHALSLCRE